MTAPLIFEWDGVAMVPLRRFAKRCDEEFVIGKCYRMEPVDEYQSARDRAYHASLREIWLNLPEGFDEQFPSYDDFRAYCLIKCGFCSIARIPCPSVKSAQALLPHVTPNEFAIVELDGPIILITKAKSQKLSERRGGMPKDQRLRSYKETLDFASSLIGVDRRIVEENAEAHA